MDVKLLTEKFAEAVGYGTDMLEREEIRIETDQDALEFCLKNNKLYFETWEVSLAIIDGEEYRTDPKNHSERRYVGLSTIFEKNTVVRQMGVDLELMQDSIDELNQQIEKEDLTALDDGKVEDRDRLVIEHKILQCQRLELEHDGEKRRYVNINENDVMAKPEYMALNEGEIVYNPQGKKIWPAP